MRAVPVLILVAGLASSMLLAGCWHLSPAELESPAESRSPVNLLSAQRMTNGSVALEIAVVTIPESLAGEFESLWSASDVQFLDLEQRRLLDANGFRCAVLGTRLPAGLMEILAWTPPVTGEVVLEDGRSLQSFEQQPVLATRRLEQLQPGTDHWVPCSPPHPELIWALETGDGQKQGTCDDATCGMTVGLISADDGAVHLWVRAEIMHGERRMRYGIDENDFLLESRQARLTLPELDFNCRLLPGQTLMIAGTPIPPDESAEESPAPLGVSFFGSQDAGSVPGRFLLIRPVQIQSDDLFQSGNTVRRLATGLD
jgi:hypothetical protein